MSSPHEQNTMIGDLMLRRSIRSPFELCSSPETSLLPTNSWSAIDCISSAPSSTGLPHHFSNSRKRGGSVLLGAEEMQSIADQLFVGNKLVSGELHSSNGLRIDLRNIKSPIIVFCSWGDDITPP